MLVLLSKLFHLLQKKIRCLFILSENHLKVSWYYLLIITIDLSMLLLFNRIEFTKGNFSEKHEWYLLRFCLHKNSDSSSIRNHHKKMPVEHNPNWK